MSDLNILQEPKKCHPEYKKQWFSDTAHQEAQGSDPKRRKANKLSPTISSSFFLARLFVFRLQHK